MKVEERTEAERYKKNLYRQLDNVNQVKKDVAHIRSPYSVHQILDKYCKGDYNAELLLQHCLIILVNNNFKFDSSEGID